MVQGSTTSQKSKVTLQSRAYHWCRAVRGLLSPADLFQVREEVWHPTEFLRYARLQQGIDALRDVIGDWVRDGGAGMGQRLERACGSRAAPSTT